MREPDDSPADGDAERAIPDLRGMPLEEVLGPGNSALDHALRRRIGDVSQPGENYAAHGTCPASPDESSREPADPATERDD
jgi:hypothetical protein